MEKFLELLDIETMSEEQVKLISPLKLAYIGDAVYEVYIRSYVVNKIKTNVNSMNKMAVKYVKAEAQAKVARGLKDLVSEKEWTILKRGRNQKSATVAKNASIGDYRYATGFEALIGYLYLSGNNDRIREIIKYSIDVLEGKVNNEL
ncbi:MAG: Mini-ribonuclease 3 [Firmicutes bacterium]|nr:Mini-ribonuclease 3 [Bacillota bacterium]